jgi:SAM-dependent methyltransferase
MFKRYFDNQFARDEFVKRQIAMLPKGAKILDAGAGSQRYRGICSDLHYFAQDFGQVVRDERMGFTALKEEYEYGPLDFVCDICSIPVENAHFDAVLCTEVFEHIPDPVSALKELSRVLSPGGVLILTFPSNCLRHFDPYFFSSGFSDRWAEHWLPKFDLEIAELIQDGNYFKWLSVEFLRMGRQNILAIPLLAPAFLYTYIRSFYSSPEANATLCGGYYVLARKVA